MFKKIQCFVFNYKEYFVLLAILILFLTLRLPAIHSPYHQDEYKWPMYAYNIGYTPGSVPHPPLTEFIYNLTGRVFNQDNFRLTPLIFSVANLFLLYYIVRKRYSVKVAQITTLLFTVSFYGVLASLMVDTDGAILPFFFLLSLLFYDRLAEARETKIKIWWGSLLGLSLLLGLMVKMSFILVLGALILDFLWRERRRFNKKFIIYILAGAGGFVIVFGLLLWLSKYIFPGFNFLKGISYWETFMRGFGSRNFFQTAIQFFKALLFLSPFLVLFSLTSLFPYRKDLRLFHIFIGLGLIFYLIIFDFSIGALDRYLQFLVIPLCVITGVMMSSVFEKYQRKISKSIVCIGTILVALFFSLQFINNFVPPLYPKTEWLNRIFSLQWNFLYPFSGGSGPLGFYLSWLFVGGLWILGLILVGFFFWKKNWQRETLIVFLVLFGVYSLTFDQEYLFGQINGSAPTLVSQATAFIKKSPDIKSVMVYNDNGGWNIRELGKYYKRIYAVPDFEKGYESIFNDFEGHILYVNIPRISDSSLYAKYFNSCSVIFSSTDKYITGKVLSCSKSKKK